MKYLTLLFAAFILAGCVADDQELLLSGNANGVCAAHPKPLDGSYNNIVSCWGTSLTGSPNSPIHYGYSSAAPRLIENADTFLNSLSLVSDIHAGDSFLCVINHENNKLASKGKVKCIKKTGRDRSIGEVYTLDSLYGCMRSTPGTRPLG